MTSKVFVWWALIAVIVTYGGLIIQNFSNKRIWKTLALLGQIIGASGLVAILLYLGIK